MISANVLYEACGRLFGDYPLAVQPGGADAAACSLLLLVPAGDSAEFAVLSRHPAGTRAEYALGLRSSGEVVGIRAEGGGAAVPELLQRAVTSGVPIPRDGSLFGWLRGDAVMALIVVYARCAPGSPPPSWAVMPRAGVPEASWPPFARERVLGHWFWELCRGGSIVPLTEMAAANPGTLFWADTAASVGSDCCLVAREVRSPHGYMLPAGVYTYSETLRAGGQLPSLSQLLAGEATTDLAPRFRRRASRGAGTGAAGQPACGAASA